ncbi:MAG: HWE histidine kinase domain-containing protein, partial [Planctomycetota bacterium]|nr:HWE histidine kinase domain-containing protein [Planctomycetota bacterium]
AIEQEIASQNYNATIELDDEPHFMRLSPAGIDVGLDWRLGTIIPESDFLLEIEDHFYRSLILSLAVVVIVVIFAWATFRWLLDPLLKLIKALKRIGQGDLETRVNLGTTSEYVKLGHAINDMTASLQQSHQKEVLLRHELDHRVKNMLAQIVALCQQTATQASTDRDLIDNLASRVASLSGVHELLGDREQFGLPLFELVTQCTGPYISNQDCLQMSGPGIFVRSKAAMCLSLVVNELATNSTKHGALSRLDGFIEITWQILDQFRDDERIEFKWIETRGKAPTGKIRQGFGTKVLEELIPYEIAGTADLDFKPEGLHYTVSIPIKYFMSMNKA